MYLKDEAAFTLKSFRVENCSMEHDEHGKLDLELIPKGIFYSKKSLFHVTFEFNAFKAGTKTRIINCNLRGIFEFRETMTFEDVPKYFYDNALAILYPYLRSFISNMTLQANSKLLVLPTMNLSKTAKVFMDNIEVVGNE